MRAGCWDNNGSLMTSGLSCMRVCERTCMHLCYKSFTEGRKRIKHLFLNCKGTNRPKSDVDKVQLGEYMNLLGVTYRAIDVVGTVLYRSCLLHLG